MRAGGRRQSSRRVPGQEERALPATGGARKRGALVEERALPATGGARKRGALEEERALPAFGGARGRGAANVPRGCGGRAQPAPRSDDARGLRLAPAPARLPRPADGTAPASLGPAPRDPWLQRHG